MVLNGDILEYHDVGPMENVVGTQGDIDLAAIELLLNFMEFAWAQWSYTSVMRLNGGYQQSYESFIRQAAREEVDTYVPFSLREKLRVKKAVRNRKIVKAVRRYGPYAGGIGAAGYTGLTWKKIGMEKRAKRKMAKLARTNPSGEPYDFEFMEEEEDPLPKEYPKSVQKDIAYPLNAQTNIQIKDPMVSGYEMLSFKNQLTRMYKTHMKYEMSPVKITQLQVRYKSTTPWYEDTDPKVYNHSTFPGNGPALYTIYDDTTLSTGSVANSDLNRALDLFEAGDADTGGHVTYLEWKNATDNGAKHRNLGCNSIVYVFTVDWVGTYMNPCSEMQVTKYKNTTDPTPASENLIPAYPSWVANQMNGNLLQFQYELYDSNTDANVPIKMFAIWANKDWTYLTHYYTVYNFKFRNLSVRNYMVEILVFKFKAEQETFNYDRMTKVVVNKQSDKYQDYFDGVSAPPQDIIVLYRKRIKLAGMSKNLAATSGFSVNQLGTNCKNFKYVHKRKYVLKRPILNGYNSFISEEETYNTYYDFQKGHYMRIQAWPIAPLIGQDPNLTTGPGVNQNEDQNCYPGTLVGNEEGTKLMNAVAVTIDKKSYFKLDEPIYKSYTAS